MAQTVLNVGSNANDGTGDSLRSAMISINANFTELYAASPVNSQISLSGNEISSTASNANLKLTASGTGVIELEGIQIRDNHIEGTRSNEDLVINPAGTGALDIQGNTTVTGTLTATSTFTADTIDTNNISSSDSTAIQINDALNVTGTITVDTLDVNNLSSTDSSAIQISDDVNISGTLTAGSITGLSVLSNSSQTDGSVTISSSAETNMDTFAVATFRSATYAVSISDSTNTRFALHNIQVVHDGTNAFITDTEVSPTGSSMATFSADIDSGNVRVRVVPASADSTTYKFVRTAINV